MTLLDFMSENPFLTLLLAGLGIYAVVASAFAIAAVLIGSRRKP